MCLWTGKAKETAEASITVSGSDTDGMIREVAALQDSCGRQGMVQTAEHAVPQAHPTYTQHTA